MALTCYGKNQGIAAVAGKKNPTKSMQFVGLMEAKELKSTETNVGAELRVATPETTAGAKAKVWVVFESVTGGTGSTVLNSIVAFRPYLIKKINNGAAGTGYIEICNEEGGTAITPTNALTGYTAFVMVAEPVKARVETAFAGATATLGEIADTAKTLEVEAGKKIRYASWWSSLTETAAEFCMSITKLEIEETYGSAGKYELTSDKLEGNPATVG